MYRGTLLINKPVPFGASVVLYDKTFAALILMFYHALPTTMFEH